jgi:hypothetical protein
MMKVWTHLNRGFELQNLQQTILAVFAVILCAGHASAATLTASATGTGGGAGHAQVDSVSGKVYTHSGFYGNQGAFGYYDTVADFEAKSGFTAVTVPNMPWGSYFSANNDVITARADSNSNNLQTFNGITGASIASASITGHCGNNVSCGFNWGGFSSMNLMQDQTGNYLLGVDVPNGDWILSSISSDLSVTEITRFDKTNSNDGYGFMIGGTLFLGEGYNSNTVAQAYNTITDTFFDPDIDLVLAAGLYNYRSSTFYDGASDTLFMALGSEGEFAAKVTGAMAAFNVAPPPSPVPLPAGVLLLLSGLAGVAGLKRWKKHTA